MKLYLIKNYGPIGKGLLESGSVDSGFVAALWSSRRRLRGDVPIEAWAESSSLVCQSLE